MNNTLRITLAAALLAITQGAFAHDPAEHAKEAEEAKKGADCAAMKDMDHSKMDMNDPVMKAMMTKCAAAKKPTDPKAMKDMKGMEGMDHSKMAMPAADAKKSDGHEGH